VSRLRRDARAEQGASEELDRRGNAQLSVLGASAPLVGASIVAGRSIGRLARQWDPTGGHLLRAVFFCMTQRHLSVGTLLTRDAVKEKAIKFGLRPEQIAQIVFGPVLGGGYVLRVLPGQEHVDAIGDFFTDDLVRNEEAHGRWFAVDTGGKYRLG
jgi:hypothetical protein